MYLLRLPFHTRCEYRQAQETDELAKRYINNSLMGMTPRPVGMGYGTISAGSKQAPRDEECCLLATIAG